MKVNKQAMKQNDDGTFRFFLQELSHECDDDYPYGVVIGTAGTAFVHYERGNKAQDNKYKNLLVKHVSNSMMKQIKYLQKSVASLKKNA